MTAHPQESGALQPIDEAPRNGTAFRAILAETGERVEVRYDTNIAYYSGEDRWYDDNGDGAPDGHCRTWEAWEIAGWLPAEIAARVAARTARP